jgi:hypothetical protein
LVTAFFIAEVQGSYNLILEHDYIHANHGVPPRLHQFLIQWVGDDIKLVHADSLAYVSTTDAPSVGGMMVFPACLVMTFLIFSLSVSLGRVVPISLKPIVNQLNIIM